MLYITSGVGHIYSPEIQEPEILVWIEFKLHAQQQKRPIQTERKNEQE